MDQIKQKFMIQSGYIGFYHIPDLVEREMIHQYLEKTFPDIKKASLICPAFSIITKMYARCYQCQKVIEVSYKRGYEENNKDEFYFGQCCDFIHWEPNFDDQVDGVWSRTYSNIIAFGDYFKGYTNKSSITKFDAKEDHIIKIMKDKVLMKELAPTYQMNRSDIGIYLTGSRPTVNY